MDRRPLPDSAQASDAINALFSAQREALDLERTAQYPALPTRDNGEPLIGGHGGAAAQLLRSVGDATPLAINVPASRNSLVGERQSDAAAHALRGSAARPTRQWRSQFHHAVSSLIPPRAAGGKMSVAARRSPAVAPYFPCHPFGTPYAERHFDGHGPGKNAIDLGAFTRNKSSKTVPYLAKKRHGK